MSVWYPVNITYSGPYVPKEQKVPQHRLQDLQAHLKQSASVYEALTWIWAAHPYWHDDDTTRKRVRVVLGSLQEAPYHIALVASIMATFLQEKDLSFPKAGTAEPMVNNNACNIALADLHNTLDDVPSTEVLLVDIPNAKIKETFIADMRFYLDKCENAVGKTAKTIWASKCFGLGMGNAHFVHQYPRFTATMFQKFQELEKEREVMAQLAPIMRVTGYVVYDQPLPKASSETPSTILQTWARSIRAKFYEQS